MGTELSPEQSPLGLRVFTTCVSISWIDNAEGRLVVPEFMDVHRSMQGVTPEALKEAHEADLAIQDEEGVNFKQAWGDPESGMVFCLSEAPDAEAVRKIHERTGHPADDIYPVPVQA